MEVSGYFNAATALPRGKSSLYLLDRRLDGLKSLSLHAEKRKIPYFCRESKLGRTAWSTSL
jgi:hypothetical protein